MPVEVKRSSDTPSGIGSNSDLRMAYIAPVAASVLPDFDGPGRDVQGVHSPEKLEPFYAGRLWRKMRLNGYLNRARSERTMLAGFQATFGAPANVVIGMGDWEQRGHCKFKEPTKGKGLRTLLRRAGYRGQRKQG
jgi:hypothetical protein